MLETTTKREIYNKKTRIMKAFYDLIDVIRLRKLADKEKSNQVIDMLINFISQTQIPKANIDTIRNLNQQVTLLLKIRDNLQNITEENISNIIEFREQLQTLIEEESKLW